MVHHLVVDGVSWRVMVEDLERGYGQSERGRRDQVGGEDDRSYGKWAEGLRGVCGGGRS